MKAAIYTGCGGPEVLRYQDVPDPVPGPDKLLIRVEAISIEGGDIVARRSRPREAGMRAHGYAAAGEVIGLGPGVEGFAIGQKVTTFAFEGSHAELRAAPAATSWIVPPGLDMATAAAIPCAPGTAALVYQLGRLKAGQTVLILGAAGGVGVAAVQLAHAAGARVIGTGTNVATLEKLKAYGLSDGIVVQDGRPISEQVRALLGGKGVDLLVDNIGGATLADALLAIEDGGCAVLVGLLAGIDARIDALHLLRHRLTVIGCLLGAIMHEQHVRQMITDLLGKAARGEFKVPIDATFRLSEAAEAHSRAEERGRLGRVIMVP